MLGHDFETLLTLKEFEELEKKEEGFIKPVIIITVESRRESQLPESYIFCC